MIHGPRWIYLKEQNQLEGNFSSSETYKYMYTKSMNGDYVIIYLYVDDMLIFCTFDDIIFKNKSFFDFEI
ncbi:hypothetical protein CR513_35356, partial [Mucuna pruriens]